MKTIQFEEKATSGPRKQVLFYFYYKLKSKIFKL